MLLDFINPLWWGQNLIWILPFYIVTLILSIVQYPIWYKVLPTSFDNNWSLHRLLSLFFPAWCIWYISSIFSISVFITIPTCLSVIVICGIGLGVYQWDDFVNKFKKLIKIILIEELILLLLFAFLIGIRSYFPAISWDPNDYGAEKFTDMAMLTSCMKTQSFPPQDPWLAGEPINYYYFGHWVWAFWFRLINIPQNIGFNLILGFIYSLSVIILYSAFYHLTKAKWISVVGAIMIQFGGNVLSLLQLIYPFNPQFSLSERIQYYDFWDPSRAISGTITEFPAFSFILGDPHAHITGYLLVIGILLFLITLIADGKLSLYRQELPSFIGWFPGLFLVGMLYATNSWDLISILIIAPLILGFVVYINGWKESVLVSIVTGLSILISSMIIQLPQWLNFKSPVLGTNNTALPIAIPFKILPPEYQTQIFEFLLHWGWPMLFLFLGISICKLNNQSHRYILNPKFPLNRLSILTVGITITFWIGSYITPLGTKAIFYPPFDRALFWMFISILFSINYLPQITNKDRIIKGCIISSQCSLIFCEIVYLDDVFQDDLIRINTVFKMYYIVWPIFLLSTFSFFYIAVSDIFVDRSRTRNKWVNLSWLALAIILLPSIIYPFSSFISRKRGMENYRSEELRTIDGWDFALSKENDLYFSDYDLIRQLSKTIIQQHPVIMEGSSGTYDYSSRFSTNLGGSSVLGWQQHTASWRGGNYSIINSRIYDIEKFYTTDDIEAFNDILDRYKINTVILGKLETEMYGNFTRNRLEQYLIKWNQIKSNDYSVWIK